MPVKEGSKLPIELHPELPIFRHEPDVVESSRMLRRPQASSEVPPTESNAKGKAEVTYDDSTKILRWSISYWGLTGSATAAHFHGPAGEGENAGVMITISPLPSPMKGAAILTEDQSKALLSGNLYINVHTAKYPDGEIRGQLTPAS